MSPLFYGGPYLPKANEPSGAILLYRWLVMVSHVEVAIMTNNTIGYEGLSQQLYRKIWITKGTRFNAHQRLMAKHKWSTAAIAFSSVYVLIISMVGYVHFPSIDSQGQDIIAFSAIILSLFILVLSLLESSQSYQIRAREFHNCGRKLSGIYDDLLQIRAAAQTNATGTNIPAQLAEITKKYDDILDQCPENHETIDFDLFKIQNNNEFHVGILGVIFTHVSAWFHTFLIYLVLIVVPPMIVTILFSRL